MLGANANSENCTKQIPLPQESAIKAIHSTRINRAKLRRHEVTRKFTEMELWMKTGKYNRIDKPQPEPQNINCKEQKAYITINKGLKAEMLWWL